MRERPQGPLVQGNGVIEEAIEVLFFPGQTVVGHKTRCRSSFSSHRSKSVMRRAQEKDRLRRKGTGGDQETPFPPLFY